MTKTAKVFNGAGDIRNVPVNSYRPMREPSTKSDVDVPLKAAAGAMVLTMFLFVGIMLYLEQSFNKSMLGLAIIICSVIGIVVFFLMTRWSASVIWATERVAQVDMDDDGIIGEPTHPVLVNKNNNRIRRDPAIEWRNGFEEYVNHLYTTNGLNHHSAREKFTEKQINAYRDYAINLGIIKWKNPKNHQSGIELVLDQIEAELLLDKTMWVDIDKTERTKR